MFALCKAINGDKLDILVGQISSQRYLTPCISVTLC